jgi:D-cysteine desulfhydrase
MVEAIQLFARFEGILLDPVYTGKAAAGLLGLVRTGRFGAGERVLLIHTGGSPALYAYQDVVLQDLGA